MPYSRHSSDAWKREAEASQRRADARRQKPQEPPRYAPWWMYALIAVALIACWFAIAEAVNLIANALEVRL